MQQSDVVSKLYLPANTLAQGLHKLASLAQLQKLVVTPVQLSVV